MKRRGNDCDCHEEGWTPNPTVHMDQGQVSSVLGPDGEPVQYVTRNRVGFDLRPRERRK